MLAFNEAPNIGRTLDRLTWAKRVVPVVTTTGAPWKALVTERAGWWVAPAVPALTDALRAATAMPLDAMGARGRAHVEATLGWPGIARQMADVYRWLLGRAGQPSCISFS